MYACGAEGANPRTFFGRIAQEIVAAGMDAHPAGIDSRGNQMRAAIRILYFVSEMIPGIEAETEAKAEAIVQLEIVLRSSCRIAANATIR